MHCTVDGTAATDADRRWMQRAIDLSRLCPPTHSAYSVGAVIVAADGSELATGYSRDTDPQVHAEESALAQVDSRDPLLLAATIYSTLEPCSRRSAPRTTCSELIIAAGLPRVVIAWREPALFVHDHEGVERLQQAGISILEMPDFASAARAANAHLPLQRLADAKRVRRLE